MPFAFAWVEHVVAPTFLYMGEMLEMRALSSRRCAKGPVRHRFDSFRDRAAAFRNVRPARDGHTFLAVVSSSRHGSSSGSAAEQPRTTQTASIVEFNGR